APIAGLIAAVLTVPPVIAFYLLKLRRRPVRVGSVMFWERAVRDAQGNTPWRMVRPQTQLVLQLLALALLLLAFARPVVPGELGGRVMLVLDRSASMNATDGAGGNTRFEEARDKLRGIATELASASNTRVMVVALGAEAAPATPWTSDRTVLLGALDAIEPTDEEASTDALVELVRLAASGEDTSADTDGEERSEPETLTIVLASDGDLPDPRDPLPANVVPRLESVGGALEESKGNAGIVAVAAQRLYDDPAAVRVFARVQAVGPMRRELPVRLALNGQVVAETVAQLTPGENDLITQASVTLSTVAPEAGVLSVLLPGDDLLSADDSASLWLRTAGRPRVLMVIPEDELVDPDRPGPVLLIAAVLEAMDLGSLRIVRLSRYEQFAGEGALPFDTIVFDRVAPRTPPSVSSLHFGPPPPLVRDGGAFRAAAAGELEGTRVISWRRTHPVLRDVALDQLAVAEPLITDGDSDDDGGGAVVLASGERGPLIVAFDGQQHRRIWVGFEPAMSNWPKLVSFPLFIAEAVDYLSMRGSRDAAESTQAGAIATLSLAEPRSRVRVVGPQGDYELATSTPTTRPAIGPIERAGVYLFQEARVSDQRAIAVNVVSEIESRIGVPSALPASLGGLPEAQARATRSGGERELWPWFLLAGLAVLCLEWLFSARSLGR
ncbi:MAG: BatA and WFA domain-containing protein, partial [Phycisphaerales bacterium JB064]